MNSNYPAIPDSSNQSPLTGAFLYLKNPVLIPYRSIDCIDSIDCEAHNSFIKSTNRRGMKMLSLDEFMKSVKERDLNTVKNIMLPCEKAQGNADRVEAIREYLESFKSQDATTSASQINLHSDVGLAVKYIAKKNNCRDRNIDFLLSFSEYKRLMNRKKCYYTGITMTLNDCKSPTHKTIDRIDSSLGYLIENCVTCTNYANALKATVMEQSTQKMVLTVAQFKRMASKL